MEYKLSVLAEAEQCSKPGQIETLLRRDGLYASHLPKWREQGEAGGLGQHRGRKPNSETAETKRLHRENKRQRRQLVQTEHFIDAQENGGPAWDKSGRDPVRLAVIMSTCTELATVIGAAEACRGLGIPGSIRYRPGKPV